MSIRNTDSKIKLLDTLTQEEIVDEMLSYFNRNDEHNQIRASIKQRYGIGIKVNPDPNNAGGNAQETYEKGTFATKVDEGIIEAIASGFGPRVVNALASLFTETGKGFSLTHETIDDLEEVEEVLQRYREEGGLAAQLVKCDRRSIQVGSSGILVSWSNDGLSYQVISPSELRAYFSETIDENGKIRAVDTADLEDATCITIRLSQVDAVTWNYLAIFGRSEEYPKGRWVYYEAASGDTEIPEVGDKGAMDHEMDGEVANPLSYYAADNPDDNLPEYPIMIIDGGVTEDTVIMPVYTSLYEDCLSMDTGASHLSATSQDAARGTLALTVDETATGMPLPRSLHGAIALFPGQGVEYHDHNAENSKVALDVMQGLMINIAGGYSVPDYMVVPDDSAISKESGVALMVKTEPLKKARQFRIELNSGAVRKLHQIDTILIHLHSEEDEALINQLLETSQMWDAGEIKIPETPKDKTERINAAKDSGLMDEIAGIRDYYNLPTDEEAIKIYEQMKDRAADYPPLKQEEAPKKIGLPGRGQQPV